MHRSEYENAVTYCGWASCRSRHDDTVIYDRCEYKAIGCGRNTNVSRDVGAVQASLDCQLEDENRVTVNAGSAGLGWKVEVR